MIGQTQTIKIPDLAAKELKAHRVKTENLTKELIQKHNLSKSAAKDCVKNILRHQETHGEKSSSSQMATMVQISGELDKKSYDPAIGSHNIECLRRRDGDLQFRNTVSQDKDLSGFREFSHKAQGSIQPQSIERSFEKKSVDRSIEENSKGYEMEI